LAFGKRVDEQAKELSYQVDALIQPHQEQLEAIARREAERIGEHQRVLDWATNIGIVGFGEGSPKIQDRLDALDEISLEGLKEFTEKVAAAIVASRKALQQALSQALAAEEQARKNWHALRLQRRSARPKRRRSALGARPRGKSRC
jgi:hypothetical protein